MALVFAVFLFALLVVFTRPDGRAQRIARVKDVLSRAARMTRAVRKTGTEAVERIAAELAQDHRSIGGADQFLTPADRDGAEHHQPRTGS